MSQSLLFGNFKKDMTFYSWMGLMQSLNGTTNAHALSKILMGNISSGLRTDFPSNLRFFCQQTSNAYGNETYIIQNHTSLPYFTSFRDERYFNTSITIMSNSTVEALKFHLGLPPSNLSGYVPLKFCLACYYSDLSLHGFAYWHRTHQLPTSYICSEHGETLEFQSLRKDGRGRSTLILPSEQHSQKLSLSELEKPTLARLSVLTEKILQHPLGIGFNSLKLFNTYRHGLKEQGFLTRRGFIRASEFIGKFKNHYSSIKLTEPYSEILSDHKIENMLKLLRKPRGNHHTAEHIILIDFLFGTWDLFSATYAWESQFQLELRNDSKELLIPIEHFKTEQIDEIAKRYECGESLSSLCLEKNLDIGTVMRQINKRGLTKIKKRPKILTESKIQKVVNLLQEGESISEIIRQTNLSKSTIDRVCSDNQEIWHAWKIAKLERMRDDRRHKLSAHLLLQNSASVSDIKSKFPKEFKWLSKHDPEWINHFLKSTNLSPIKRLSIASKPRVDWNTRDEVCLKYLQAIGKPELESWERKKPQAFIRRLPKLSFSPRLERLPKSGAWIKEQLNILEAS